MYAEAASRAHPLDAEIWLVLSRAYQATNNPVQAALAQLMSEVVVLSEVVGGSAGKHVGGAGGTGPVAGSAAAQVPPEALERISKGSNSNVPPKYRGVIETKLQEMYSTIVAWHRSVKADRSVTATEPLPLFDYKRGRAEAEQHTGECEQPHCVPRECTSWMTQAQ